MLSFRSLVALVAASGVVGSPIKPRAQAGVDIEYVTVVDMVMMTASPEVVATVHVDAVVTEPPVVVVITATAQETAAIISEHNLAAPVAEAIVTVTAPAAQPSVQSTSTPVAVEPASPSEILSNANDNGPITLATASLVVLSVAPIMTSEAPSSPTAITASAAAPSAVSSDLPTSSSANNDQASVAGDYRGLPTNTIIHNLQSTDTTYKNLVLYAHNVHRANHTDTKNLVYNNTLEGYAKEKSQGCTWDEDLPADASAADVGMNMAEGTYIGAANITAIISDMWYNGEIDLFPGYGIEKPSMTDFDAWGHYTQVVWRDTTSVGCWSSPCSRNDGTANEIGSGYFTVCMYYPPANIPGEYADQVGTPEGQSTIGGV